MVGVKCQSGTGDTGLGNRNEAVGCLRKKKDKRLKGYERRKEGHVDTVSHMGPANMVAVLIMGQYLSVIVYSSPMLQPGFQLTSPLMVYV